MLKTRIIPTVLCRRREQVKGNHFDSTRRIGNAMQACRVHNMRGVDELVLLEVGGGMIDLETVNALASECFMPLAIGGGIRTLEDIHWLLGAGADKVIIRRAASYRNGALISEASRKFGAQAVVVSIDVLSGISLAASRPHHSGYGYVLECEYKWTNPVLWAKEVERLGAGEILLQSVERDGTLSGYDLDLIAAVSHAVSIPVIASGGCGTYEHMAEALRADAHAVAAGALFAFTEATPQGAAKYLTEHGFSVRTDNVMTMQGKA